MGWEAKFSRVRNDEIKPRIISNLHYLTLLKEPLPLLQIKSLLGHRSQAAPEVRLVSGRHLKEFCEFLQSQSEHFVVEGDRVRLKVGAN